MKTCLNCEAELSEYNKTDYCTSFCERKRTGEVRQQKYNNPIKVEQAIQTVEKKADWLKQPIDYTPRDYILTMTDGNIFKLVNPNDKHPSIVVDSFHERIIQVINADE